MNNTPTPRTDAAAWPETDLVEGNFARILERELTAVTEKLKETRKHLKDANRGAEISAHALRINADKLIAVTEQRDEYKAALQSADNHNHEIGTKLEIVTEQRERLADLVKQFIYILDITEESDGGRLFHPTNITSCRAGDLQKAGQLVEALRRASRNQPTP